MTPLPPFPCAFIGSIGGFELGLIMVVVLLLFGPKKIPEVARTLGRIMEELRKASAEFKSQVMSVTEETRDTARAIRDDLSVPQAPMDAADDYQSMNPYEQDEYQKRLHDASENAPDAYGPGGPEPVADGTPSAPGGAPDPSPSDPAPVETPAVAPAEPPPAPLPDATASEAGPPESRNV